MSSSSASVALLARFVAGGAFNTAFGLGAILLLMQAGVPALAANCAGYAAGLLLSFAVNRRFVFRGRGAVTHELRRYAGAFLLSFSANVAVLEVLVRTSTLDPRIAQLVAVAAYVVLMFVLCRSMVFRQRAGEP